LNLSDELCSPPLTAENVLARAAEDLYHSKKEADMTFEIIEDEKVTSIEAHRVVVAARCDWFRRALLSGK